MCPYAHIHDDAHLDAALAVFGPLFEKEARTPAETRETRDRLVASGYPEMQGRRLIGCIVASEIFEAPRREEPYDEARYVAAPRRLPTLP